MVFQPADPSQPPPPPGRPKPRSPQEPAATADEKGGASQGSLNSDALAAGINGESQPTPLDAQSASSGPSAQGDDGASGEGKGGEEPSSPGKGRPHRSALRFARRGAGAGSGGAAPARTAGEGDRPAPSAAYELKYAQEIAAAREKAHTLERRLAVQEAKMTALLRLLASTVRAAV